MISEISKEQLIEALAQEHAIEAKQLKEIFEISRQSKQSVFHLLIEREILKEGEVIDFLSRRLEIPILNLAALRIPGSTVAMVPKRMVDRYHVLPISRIANMLTIATSDPFDLMSLDDLKELTHCEISLVLCSPKLIASAIDACYGDTDIEKLLEGINVDSLEIVHDQEPEKGGGGIQAGEDAPVIKMVKLVIREAIRLRASDIHFEPYEKDFRVRYRIDGCLRESFSYARNLYNPLVARIKIMSKLDITEKRLPQDGRFRDKVGERELDFRVSILPIYHGEKIVLRVLDRGGVKSGLQNLGFTEKPTQIFAEAVKNPYGMILVTGPTGSGKSTTLYTILNTMNTPDRNIMTIEDPVEYQIEGITQTQVQAEIGLTFANGLRALIRQSPDIILVGEIRDTETADIAVKAALIGHLVFSTLHTNSAAGAMTRLIDMGVEPFLIASSVICVAAQRLMRRICERCKAPEIIPAEVLRRCGLKPSDLEQMTPYKGKGCSHCNQTGYHGRLGVIEILTVDSDIRNLVIERKSSDDIEKVAIQKGMETLFENAFEIFRKGLTTLEEVLRVTSKE